MPAIVAKQRNIIIDFNFKSFITSFNIFVDAVINGSCKNYF